MGRKRGMLSTVLTLGGLAAVGAAVYRNRDLIRTFLSEASGTYTPEETSDYGMDFAAPEPRPADQLSREEPLIVIDNSSDEAEAE